jgi:hypothetical protein
MFRALAIVAGVLILVACGGGDDDSARSTISQDQIEAWADEVWEKALPELSASLAEACPDDPSKTPGLSIAPLTNTDIPKEAQPAVGRLLAEKVYAFCRSQAQ